MDEQNVQITLTATKVSLSLQNIFVATKHVFCCDKTCLLLRQKYAFVATNTCYIVVTNTCYPVATDIILSLQKFCSNKHTFVATKDVLCHDKHMFVATKMMLVAGPANDISIAV